jgi:hypothetical protein
VRFKISLLFVAMATIMDWLPAQATININVEAVQKSVVFLYAARADGSVDKNKPIGTGFLVGIPIKSDSNRSYAVLVTARHMVDPTWAKCGIANPSVVYMRLKTYTPGSDDPGFDFVPVPLIEQGTPTWVHHTETDIDAAVVPFPKNVDQFDFILIPVELSPRKRNLHRRALGTL